METMDTCAALRAHVASKYKTQDAAAVAWGVSKSFVSLVLNNKRTPSNYMLKDAGIKKEAT